MTALRTGADGVRRCWWCGDDPGYVAYHDREWGRPVTDDRRLLEKLCLEGFQCGLSWLTILRKRPRFREVFHDFEPERMARMTGRDVARLLGDAGIVRHRGKIESAINNARRTLEVGQAHGSLADWLWSLAPPSGPAPRRREDLPASTDASRLLGRALKRQGFTYVGPTTVYAFMQAVGMVNDHLVGCRVRGEVGRAQRQVRVERLGQGGGP